MSHWVYHLIFWKIRAYRYRSGEDYIPVQGDLSDLGAKLDSAVADTESSAAMATRWVERGRDVLSMECILE